VQCFFSIPPRPSPKVEINMNQDLIEIIVKDDLANLFSNPFFSPQEQDVF